jgi:hypothetical protein
MTTDRSVSRRRKSANVTRSEPLPSIASSALTKPFGTPATLRIVIDQRHQSGRELAAAQSPNLDANGPPVRRLPVDLLEGSS